MIKKTFFSQVTTTSATLQAEIDPNGKATKYHFAYGPDDCASNPCTTVPAGTEPQIPGSNPATLVSVPITGLAPGTIYHFQVVAKNSEIETPLSGPDTTFATYPPEHSFGPCPNDEFRSDQPSATLPDCRAYEQASPLNKNAQDARGTTQSVRAAVDGNAVTFATTNGLPGGQGGQELPTYLSSRAGGIWRTQGLLPPQTAGSLARVLGWTPDLSTVFDYASTVTEPTTTTLLSRSSADGALTTIAPYAPELEPGFVGASADGTRVFFESDVKLPAVPAALEGRSNLYVWSRDENTLALAGVLNSGQPPTEGAFAGPYDWAEGASATMRGGTKIQYYTQDDHALSADGSSIYFTAAGSGRLYLRRNLDKPQSPLNGAGECTDLALACTIEISASEKTNGGGPGGTDKNGSRPAAFLHATPDGSIAFLLSSEKLTDDANTGPEPTASPSIARAGIDGTGADLDFLPARVKGLMVSGEYLYWADPVNNRIGRVKLNGSASPGPEEPNFITDADNPQAVAVADGYIYWTNAAGEGKDEGTIGRAKLVGAGVDDVQQNFMPTSFTHLEESSDGPESFEITLFNPRGIAVNGTHIYWGNVGEVEEGFTFESALMRANLTGSEVEEYGEFEKEPGRYLPWHYAARTLSLRGGYIYFNVVNGGYSYLIRQSLLDPRDVLLKPGAAEIGTVEGVATDAAHLYWTNTTSNTIGRVNLELGEPKADFITGAGSPQSLASDAEHLYWSANQEVLANPGNDLYRFDADAEPGHRLTDLIPDPGDENGAEVRGVLGTSTDGSNVYFAANADLDGDGPASAGNCHGDGPSNEAGSCNVYRYHESDVTFVTEVPSNDGNWMPTTHSNNGSYTPRTSRVSPDGLTLLFNQEGQIFRYRVGNGPPICISCNPTGQQGSVATLEPTINLSFLTPNTPVALLTRNLSADGERVFFETSAALVAADTNSADGCKLLGSHDGHYLSCVDVYEWEADGSGSCDSDAENGGCLYLLSPPNSEEPSFFADASASGGDVFLFTRSQLVGQDQDQLLDLYDASVGGGLSSQNSVASPFCEAEACKGAAGAPPPVSSPVTPGFVGPPDPKPKHRNPKRKKKAHHKKHHKQTAHKRGGQK